MTQPNGQSNSPPGQPSAAQPSVPQLTPEQKEIILRIQTRLIQLGAEATLTPFVSVGPVVSVYRMVPTGGTTVARLEGFEDDISVALAKDVIVKRLPGEGAVGVYVPNPERAVVAWRDVVKMGWNQLDPHAPNEAKLSPNEAKLNADLGYKAKPRKRSLEIPLLFGIDHLGGAYVEDLTSLPHLLIAGSTGGGKSVFLKSLISTIVLTKRSSEVGIFLSDTKQVEFGHLRGLPHLLDEISTSPIQTMDYMDRLALEVESRLRLLAKLGVANIQEYNSLSQKDSEEGKAYSPKLQYQILFIDELADVMSIPGAKRGESKVGSAKLDLLVRRARAAGIHVIAATQRPSVDVVAGVIKANFPARLTFRLPQGSDSMTVLGTVGAEHLLTQGDMLFASPNKTGLVRLHAPFTSLDDLKACVDAARAKESVQ